jgi:hypothetical protein
VERFSLGFRKQGKTLTLALTNLQRLAKISTKIPKIENHIEEAGNFFSQKRDFAEFQKILNVLRLCISGRHIGRSVQTHPKKLNC